MELKPQIDLSWADVDSCKYLTAITKKDFPTDDELLEGLAELTIDDLYKRDRRIFAHLNLSHFKPDKKFDEYNDNPSKSAVVQPVVVQ